MGRSSELQSTNTFPRVYRVSLAICTYVRVSLFSVFLLVVPKKPKLTWKEKKKERKMVRNNYELIQKAKGLWEDLRRWVLFTYA